ncbi:hypothetical protein ACFX5K_03770 [Rickettsiales bacterium LUAb2]
MQNKKGKQMILQLIQFFQRSKFIGQQNKEINNKLKFYKKLRKELCIRITKNAKYSIKLDFTEFERLNEKIEELTKQIYSQDRFIEIKNNLRKNEIFIKGNG